MPPSHQELNGTPARGRWSTNVSWLKKEILKIREQQVGPCRALAPSSSQASQLTSFQAQHSKGHVITDGPCVL
jgi:hypothetical protein